ncbi:transportin MOS14-like isoform X3 [Carya illinoinensis]|uniref:transportin MOS14-like isoform X3 n=1 Tax=Carya illinoinensis TaxID=32201 RepID=UPI001C719ED3|nr:transportin MOS14-like isoform X3 [Carya illinoinensis]
MELQNTVKEALNALYHHPDDTVRKQADRWLQDFQHTLDAWQVADNLLHDASSNLETLIFCSQTLRTKVQRDFEELPSEAFGPLRVSLNTLLKKFHKGPPKVRTQEVYNYNIAARPERRRQFEKELISQMEVALSILTACLSINELKEQVLEAFASWLRLKHGIHGSVLASHPLVITALSSLNSEFLSEAAVNVISELIHYTSAGSASDVALQMPLIQIIVPQVMNLKAHLKDSSKDEEDVKAIARLFADMGDSYVELIATGSDESMLIVNALLEVASHPEYYIASMSFNFWHSLQVILTKSHCHMSGILIYHLVMKLPLKPRERGGRMLLFTRMSHLFPCFSPQVSFRVQYPQDYLNLSHEDRKEFKQTRYAVADILIDAASVLGGDATLQILYKKLVEAVSCCGNGEKNEWRPAEAALFCIQAISNYVSIVEAEVMPQVMSLLPKLPQQPQLLQTVCLTIGAYSKWLDSASNGLSMLASLIDILMSGMGTSEDSAAAAALAFKHICDDCRRKLCGYLDGLFHIYRRAVTGECSFKVSAEDSLHLVEALSMVVTELPPENAKRALEALCLPVVTPLQEAVSQGPEILNKKTARELTVHIDRFAYIFRYVKHPEAVADAIQRLWPIFKAIFDLRAWDMRTMESLCRACKYAVRTSGRFMGMTIGAMLEEIQGLYKQHHQPCFLYLSSEVIKIFGSDSSCATYLKNLIESLFLHTTRLLTNIQEFTARPDIADDCFLLASRCIRYCPQIFMPSEVFPSLVDCSMIGVTVQHREASNSILTFLSDIFDVTNSSKGEQYIPIRNSVVIPRGGSITRILIASLTGALPSSRFESVTYTLLALTRAYGALAVVWAKESVSLIPLTAVTEVERSRFLKALSDAASGFDINSLTLPIEEMSDVCRRNRTVQEIVQGALRPLELHLSPVSS